MSETETVTEPQNLDSQLTDLIGAIIKPEEQLQGEAAETETEALTDESVDDSVEDREEVNEIEDDESDESSSDPEWYQKRIKRFTRQLRTAESERDEALTEIEGLKEKLKTTPAPEASRVTAQSENDLIELENLEKQKIKFARDQKRLLSQGDLDAVVENIKEAGKDLDEASDETLVRDFLDEIIDDSRDNLSFEIPKRRNELQHRVQFNKVAEQKYPWLKDKGSEQMEYFQAVMKASPALANVPSGKLEIARYVTGLMAETTAQELVSQRRKPKAPRTPVRNNAAPASKPEALESISAASKRVQKTGSSKDLESLLLAGLTRS